MTGLAIPKMRGLRVFPPPPKGFDALVATKTDLVRHGLPQRPDPRKRPELAALWERRMRRYQDFEHLDAELYPADPPKEPPTSAFGLSARESCGFELNSFTAPITILSGTWTVPNLNHTPGAGATNHFRTFFGLGFLDVHVEMTVGAAQQVTAQIVIHNNTQVALPVRPGDAISATLCLQTDAAGTASYFLVNETTSQTVNFVMDTGFPPAVTINAGISRGVIDNRPDPLARFGVVYFDEIVAFTTAGTVLLTNGQQTTMIETNGTTLATPLRLNENAFKVI